MPVGDFERKIQEFDAELERIELLCEQFQQPLQLLRKEIKRWQVEEMGNSCTVCYGDNVWNKCSACGWWGKVPPK